MRRHVQALADLALGLALGLVAMPVMAADPAAAEAGSDRRAETTAPFGDLPALPEAIASFGAAVLGDQLYVYGGHVGRTHQHSKHNLSHHFRRLDLGDPQAGWQDLGEVRGLQGLAMVAHGQKVCRVGGLDARNAQGEDEDLVSIDEVTCFDRGEGTWSDQPPLPAPRSSHDAVVAGDRLFVAGGWQLAGAGREAVWHDTVEMLDLGADEPAWTSIPQPFERRALAVASAGGEIYVLGGLGPDGTSRRVDVLDPATGEWREGPALPEAEGPMKGFGVSAFGIGEMVLLSSGDGAVHALRAGSGAWLPVGQLAQPRFFHRLLPHGERILFVAGAHRGGHLSDVESLELAAVRRAAMDSYKAAAPVAEARAPIDRGSWPGFRGLAGGHLAAGELPVRWSEQEGIAWRSRVPGYGQSAPVVWGHRVLVTSVEGPRKESLILSAFDLEHGEVLWRRRFETSLPIDNDDMHSRGAPTPVVDGERVYAFWESGDLVATDHLGETLWRRSLSRDYGAFEGNHGIASSPVPAGDSIIVQVTHAGPSYFVALDRADGSVRWKADRQAGVAWTTPVVVAGASGPEIVTSAAGRVEALDGETGERLWHLGGLEKNNVPSATVDGDLVLVASSSPSHNQLIRRGSGELGASSVVWRAEGVSSGFSSPLFHGDCVLFASRKGVVTCVDRESGEEKWRHKLSAGVWASPIAAADHVFYFTEDGHAAVLRHDDSGPSLVAENVLRIGGDAGGGEGDRVYGVAAVRGAFLVRTGDELVRIGVDAPSPAPSTTLASRQSE